MYVHVLFINVVYRVSLRDALLWVVFFPLHVFYVFYGYCWNFATAILTIQLVTIGQQFLRKQMNQLNEFLLGSRKQRKNNAPLGRLWQQFTSLNQSVIELAVDISHWSAFWSPSLTLF
ncbi:hypothetical protein TYRP_022939 [Tyrophagus putrescentiae]|nr:hypothetical protein TYRP_022939 [Tyrophagus putrescentiae]